MRERPRRRVLSAEERALWERVARTTAPLPGRTPLEPSLPPAAPADGAGSLPAAAEPPPAPAAAGTKPPLPPRLAPIERRLRLRLVRGAAPIDGRLDLHGHDQAAAHRRLRSFLAAMQAEGGRVVLVITGKGREDGGDRGVLRRAVPLWLASPEFRPLVVGFEEAHPAHGGAGALYVRIRKARRPPE